MAIETAVSHPEHDGEPDSRAQAFDVLVAAVSEVRERRGRPATASEVRVAMRQRTYGGFDPPALGFPRFRDFLDEAEQLGHVRIDRARPGDVALVLPEESEAADPVPMVRPDLWRAFADWTPGQLRLYDSAEDRVHVIPEQPVPLEPERFGEVRRRLAADPSAFVPVTPVPRQRQIGWMREFADSVGDKQSRLLLRSALDGEKPAKLFLSTLRQSPPLLARWRQEHRARVREEILRWREHRVPEGVSVTVDRQEEPEDEGSRGPARELSASWGSAQLTLWAREPARLWPRSDHWHFAPTLGGDHGRESPDAALRALVHAAVDRMPVEELRALRLPVGYLVGD